MVYNNALFGSFGSGGVAVAPNSVAVRAGGQ